MNSSDVSVFQRILQNNGFVQGHYQRETDTIITATRREVINSRLNYGETIPFIKRFGDSNTILEVDINFTVDYQARDKNGIVRQLLNHLDTYVINDSLVPTLNKVGFLIHLCCHLYKEATVWDWMDKSAEIYKYCDIFVFISKFGNDKFYSEFLKAAKQLGLEKECYFTLHNTSQIYPQLKTNRSLNSIIQALEPNDKSFLTTVVWPSQHKIFRYEIDFIDWLLCTNKKELLTENANL